MKDEDRKVTRGADKVSYYWPAYNKEDATISAQQTLGKWNGMNISAYILQIVCESHVFYFVSVPFKKCVCVHTHTHPVPFIAFKDYQM